MKQATFLLAIEKTLAVFYPVFEGDMTPVEPAELPPPGGVPEAGREPQPSEASEQLGKGEGKGPSTEQTQTTTEPEAPPKAKPETRRSPSRSRKRRQAQRRGASPGLRQLKNEMSGSAETDQSQVPGHQPREQQDKEDRCEEGHHQLATQNREALSPEPLEHAV